LPEPRDACANASKPWLKHYPEDVPHELDPLNQASLSQFIEECFELFANRRFIESMGSFDTYGQINWLSKDFASYLQSLHLEKGACVALMYPNVVEYVIAMIGTLRAGFMVININPFYISARIGSTIKR